MRTSAFLLSTLVAAAALASAPARAVDSYSAEYAFGNRTQIVRAGAQWNWNKAWFEGNGTHLTGYWDLDVARWHGTRAQNVIDNVQNLWEIGITPVFRIERDSHLGPYAEAAVGAHLLTANYDNNGRRLSTHFQFGDHLGFGYVFSNKLDLGLRLQHFSNGGIKEPNSGVNTAVLRVRYPF